MLDPGEETFINTSVEVDGGSTSRTVVLTFVFVHKSGVVNEMVRHLEIVALR